MKIKVFQIEPEKDSKLAIFRSLDFQKKVYGDLKPDLYKKVFDGEIYCGDDLEQIYTKLNMGAKPYGYAGHSLSVSDIIVRSDGSAFFVDPFGFRELKGFVEPSNPEPKKAKAIPVNVLETRYKGSTNGGISEKFEQLLLLCPRGYVEVDLNFPPENLVVLVKRDMFGKCSDYIEPYAKPAAGNIGWMAGGSYAEASDSRFSDMVGFYGAVSIHDRQETPEQNALLSM